MFRDRAGPHTRWRATCPGWSCRPLFYVSSTRTTSVFILGLFVLHAMAAGDLHHWGQLLVAMGEEPVWLLVTATAIALPACPIPRSTWLVPAGVLLTFADSSLLFGGMAWVVQLFVLLGNFFVSLAGFADAVLRSWLGLLCGGLSRGPAGRLTLVELSAAGALGLWLLRAIYNVMGTWIGRRRAAKLFEMDLHCALQSPFHAPLEQGFGQFCSDAPRSEGKLLNSMSRSFSSSFIQTSDISSVELQCLQERHHSLLAARQALLEEDSEFAELVPHMLAMEVRREHIIQDSWATLLKAPLFELLAPAICVRYIGEDGMDEGGLARDWFDALGEALVQDVESDQGTSLLAMGKSSRMLIPRPSRREGAEASESFFRELVLLGRFLALSVVHGGRPLPLPLSPLVCKYIVGQPVDMRDVEHLDPAFFHERVAPLLREGGLAELEAALGEPLTFVSVPTDLRPVPEDLEPGGFSTVVTEANLSRYLQLLCEAFLCSEIRHELQCFLRGFWDVLPLEALRQSGMSTGDLTVLISGTKGLDLVQWQKHSQEDSEEGSEEIFSWFWLVVQDLDEEQRRQLLRFVTGSGRLPPGGFRAMSPPFTVVVSRAGSPEHLPHANTCINRLVLHRYPSLNQLRVKLLQVLTVQDFAFA